MIHLKYKCKVNFVKLPLTWIYLRLKLVFENVTAGRNTGCRSVVNCASCSQFPLTHSDAVCGLQNATKQCTSRYHLHTGLCYLWSAMDKTLDRRCLAHLITNFQRCRHQPQCTCEHVAGYWVLHAIAHDGGPSYGHSHCQCELQGQHMYPLWCGTPPPSVIPINRNPRGLSRENMQASELDYLGQSTG